MSEAPFDSTAGVEPSVVKAPQSLQLFNKKVLLICPWYNIVAPQTSFAISQLSDKRRTASMLNFGDAYISHSRNSCADEFLKSEFDWALWLDSDMIPPIGNAQWFRMNTGWSDFPEWSAGLNTIDRLMAHNKPLVGGLYFGRHKFSAPVYSEGASHPDAAEHASKGPHNEVRPCRWIGTGCLLTHRSVFEAIEKRFPNLRRGADGKGGQWFSSSEHKAMDYLRLIRETCENGPLDGSKAHKIYEMAIAAEADAKANSSLGMGEDVSFSVRAREAGIQPYVDLGLVCGHIGSYVYGPKDYKQKPLKSL